MQTQTQNTIIHRSIILDGIMQEMGEHILVNVQAIAVAAEHLIRARAAEAMTIATNDDEAYALGRRAANDAVFAWAAVFGKGHIEVVC